MIPYLLNLLYLFYPFNYSIWLSPKKSQAQGSTSRYVSAFSLFSSLEE
jgi:hypothetical protein